MKRKCHCREDLLHRLAQGFGVAQWAGSDAKGWSAMALGGLLGGLEEEEAQLLLHLGMIEEDRGQPFRGPERISNEAVLAFLERHGEWWFRLRLQKEIDAIRSHTGTGNRRLESEGLAYGSGRQASCPPPCPS